MCLKSFLGLTLLTGLTLLSGCSDLFTQKLVKKSLQSAQFSANCDLNIDAFSQIMYERIPEPIKCLEKNLKLFIRVVESDKPGYLSRVALLQYLGNNRTDISVDGRNALEGVFELNYLIFGGTNQYISATNIEKIIGFALSFNNIAAQNFAPSFQNTQSIDHGLYLFRRNNINSKALELTAQLRAIFNTSGEIRKLDIISLLKYFSTRSNSEAMEKVKRFLFVKKAIVGGERTVITSGELQHLINNFNNLSTIALDIVRFDNIQLDDKEIVSFLKDSLSSFTKIVNSPEIRRSDSDHLFTVQEVIDGIKMFVDISKFNVDKFRSLLNEGKIILMGGNSVNITYGEFKRLIGHGEKLLFTGTAFYQIYDNFNAQLNSTKPVNIDFRHYRDNYPDRIRELEEFSRIITKYRFYKGESASAYYSLEYRRNPRAIFEIYMYEYVLKLIFHHSSKDPKTGKLTPWGSPSNGLGGKSMSAAEVLALVSRFEKELVEMDIILPKRAASTAETVSLLGSLFQFQSDDNKVLDVNEATEFAISLFTSISISKDLIAWYKKDSGCSLDKYDRVEPVCFKKNFFKSLCKTGYSPYYPRFFEALDAPAGSCEIVMNEKNSAFMETSIRAARSCNIYPDNQKEIYYSEGDMFTIFLAMMHIETTIIKWDVRGTPNNIMDPDEVMDAYPTYSTALDGFLEELPGFVKKLKRQIYQFLIKYEEIPGTKNLWKFLKFLVSNKRAPADRKTIASILAVISEESAKKTPEEERYDCNNLHNPTANKMLELTPVTDDLPQVKPDVDHWYSIENDTDYQLFLNTPSLKEE